MSAFHLIWFQLAHRASLYISDEVGYYPVHVAAKCGSAKVLAIILQHGG